MQLKGKNKLHGAPGNIRIEVITTVVEPEILTSQYYWSSDCIEPHLTKVSFSFETQKFGRY